MYKITLICLGLFFCWQRGNSCPIHEKNQRIFAEIIETHHKKPADYVSFFSDIDLIGKEAIEQGMELSCYTYKVDSITNGLSYKVFPLWEAKEKENLVFLLFVWPSEEEGLKYCDDGYKTNIHSHPIPCAYTVMLREITERRYDVIDHGERRVQFRNQQTFYSGEKAVDLNKEPFIHQLLYEGEGRKPAITLHVYGCSSLDELTRLYAEQRNQHTYTEN